MVLGCGKSHLPFFWARPINHANVLVRVGDAMDIQKTYPASTNVNLWKRKIITESYRRKSERYSNKGHSAPLFYLLAEKSLDGGQKISAIKTPERN